VLTERQAQLKELSLSLLIEFSMNMGLCISQKKNLRPREVKQKPQG
jgi:hypothetical protein